LTCRRCSFCPAEAHNQTKQQQARDCCHWVSAMVLQLSCSCTCNATTYAQYKALSIMILYHQKYRIHAVRAGHPTPEASPIGTAAPLPYPHQGQLQMCASHFCIPENTPLQMRLFLT
jgi:hypothetical protein